RTVECRCADLVGRFRCSGQLQPAVSSTARKRGPPFSSPHQDADSLDSVLEARRRRPKERHEHCQWWMVDISPRTIACREGWLHGRFLVATRQSAVHGETPCAPGKGHP